LAFLELLARDGKAPWSEVLARGKSSALRFNQANALSLEQPPGATKFEAFGSYGWFQKYLVGGATRGHRYSKEGPSVVTVVVRDSGRTVVRLA
jgi:hypothetical protein